MNVGDTVYTVFRECTSGTVQVPQEYKLWIVKQRLVSCDGVGACVARFRHPAWQLDFLPVNKVFTKLEDAYSERHEQTWRLEDAGHKVENTDDVRE